MALVYGTDWYELKAFRIHSDRRKTTAQRFVRVVDPNNIFAFMLLMFPDPQAGLMGSAAQFPNTPFLFVESLDIGPVAGDEENFQAALSLNPANGFDVTINYSTSPFDQTGNVNTSDFPQSQLDKG